MNVSKEIIEKIINDRDFRLNTALAMGITENNVRNLAKANSSNLTKYAAVKFFKSKGFTESEIFNKQKILKK